MRFAVSFAIRTLASLLLICQGLPVLGQQSAATTVNPILPPLVKFSGVLSDVNGKPLTGVVGVTFFLYEASEGGHRSGWRPRTCNRTGLGITP